MEAAVDICPERMDAADAEAPRPPRIETAAGVATRMQTTVLSLETAVDNCPERMYAVDAGALAMRRCFWSPRKKRSKKKKQELKAAF